MFIKCSRMNISELITRYNPVPNVSLNSVKIDDSDRPILSSANNLHSVPSRSVQKSRERATVNQRREVNDEPKQQIEYNPRKVTRYIESIRRKDTSGAVLTTRQRLTFQGKKRLKKEKKSTSRIEKHLECANTRVLRKLLGKKKIKTSRKTPPQLIDRLSKLMIGSKIKITKNR